MRGKLKIQYDEADNVMVTFRCRYCQEKYSVSINHALKTVTQKCEHCKAKDKSPSFLWVEVFFRLDKMI